LAILLALGYPVSTALTVSASLAQIGEFSFILAGLGITYGLMEKEGLNLVLVRSSPSRSIRWFSRPLIA
jgi:K+:H+ antiporter